MGKKDNQTTKEPAWLNPANDRKTPYTDEEIEVFVEGFILGLDDHEWTLMNLKATISQTIKYYRKRTKRTQKAPQNKKPKNPKKLQIFSTYLFNSKLFSLK